MYHSPDTIALSLKSPAFASPSFAIPDEWQPYVHPQGWVYFVNRARKIITEHDIRDVDVRQKIEVHSQEYPPETLDEDMEVQLHESFSLVVNHRHCIASYRVEDVKNASVDECNFHQCEFTFILFHSRLFKAPQ